MDVVVGNLGLNSSYRTSPEEPFSRFIADYDQNGQQDPLLVHYLQGQQVPLHFRDDLLGWLQPLKKKFPDYRSYALADWQEVARADSKPKRTDVHTFTTSWVENLGDGSHKLHALPKEAQMAPVYGILTSDFDQDGAVDILLTGNSSAPNPFVGHLDAFNGLLLLGDGKKGFVSKRIQDSGFHVPGEGRSLALVQNKNGERMLLAAQSNGPLVVFILNKGKKEWLDMR